MEKEYIDKRIEQVGKRIRDLRKKKGYTSYEKFANEYDLNRVGYGNHEQGKNLTLKSLLRILDIHKITLEEFFRGIR